MTACLSFQDLIELSRPQVAEMQRVADSFPDAQAPGAREVFSKQVRLVEGVLAQTYGGAALIARRTAELASVAEVWGSMNSFCDSILHDVAALKPKFPDCGTAQLYDLVLDYKLACEKRWKAVQQEIECQTMDFPKGLLPEAI